MSLTDILLKANLFNDDFSKKCTAIGNNSSILANITFRIHKLISLFESFLDDIAKVIRSLDLKKANGIDDVSICIIKPWAY